MWRDFRRFTGWGEESELAGAAPEDGDPEDLPGLQFDLDQYVAEIQRFRDDRSWWTPTYTAYQIAAALAEAQLRNFERPR